MGADGCPCAFYGMEGRNKQLLSQFSSTRHICDMQFADVACALKTQTAIVTLFSMLYEVKVNLSEVLSHS